LRTNPSKISLTHGCKKDEEDKIKSVVVNVGVVVAQTMEHNTHVALTYFKVS